MVENTKADLLREKAKEAIENLSFVSAISLLQILVSSNASTEEDVILLAKSFFLSNNPIRAVHLLTKKQLLLSNAGYLIALKSNFALKEYEKCIKLAAEMQKKLELKPKIRGKKKEAGLSKEDLSQADVIVGKCHQILDRRHQAANYFKSALRYDSYNFEAFDNLANHQLIPQTQMNELIKEIEEKEGAEEEIVKVYKAKLGIFKSIKSSENNQLICNSPQVCSGTATYYNDIGDYKRSFYFTKRVLEEDPYDDSLVLSLHISLMMIMKMASELFYFAHQLVQRNPNNAMAWYSVGCYYYLIGDYENSRKYFAKTTSMETWMGSAWMGFAHSFAAQNEHDQALAAYRTAYRMMSGSHLPSLYIGVECVRESKFVLAEKSFKLALSIKPNDPFILNEMAVGYYQEAKQIIGGDITKAEDLLKKALSLIESGRESTIGDEVGEMTIDKEDNENGNEVYSPPSELYITILINLGHVCRSMKRYSESIEWFTKAKGMDGQREGLCGALSLTLLLNGQLEAALVMCHHALAIEPNDSCAQKILEKSFSLW